MKLKVTVNGIPYDIDVEVQEEESMPIGSIIIGGGAGASNAVPSSASVQATSANAVTAPLSGTVARILVEEGDEIEAGQVLCVLEAMKMETEITAPQAGKVERILVSKGGSVAGGEALIELG
ncbi:biotin/lipoyl-containing protein [Propioniciclava flava]|uniref:Acetyl-CoA carboxylase biotin carboxyl carrier protein subunit n=1 Tax=Propioniciclava flava TaxID=2072026 RepID=A0A4Q2EJS0_9ACTN|nr:biotin/lipoyl-containing protein [Propioniciclava flava]RXW32942.1 acetyl-CoA carboxylase biotin carboxyl carrier protein subunit [Propioniciclava flava]